jgi:tetratricopeptide (TPR) repeat protein
VIHAGSPDVPTSAAATPAPEHDWQALVAAGKYQAARNAYLVSGQTDPSVRAGLNCLIDIVELLRERSFGRALERVQRLEEKPAFADWQQITHELTLLKESAASLDRREPDEARQALLEVGRAWFEAELLTQLGTTYIYDSDLDEAAELFERAIELDPQHYRALTNLGNVALEQGRVDDAIQLYQRALKIDEEFPNAHHNLGVAYRKKGHLSKSVKSLRRAQRTQHKHDVVEARQSLGKWAGPGFAKYFKWLIWGLIAVGAYVILKMAGVI